MSYAVVQLGGEEATRRLGIVDSEHECRLSEAATTQRRLQFRQRFIGIPDGLVRTRSRRVGAMRITALEDPFRHFQATLAHPRASCARCLLQLGLPSNRTTGCRCQHGVRPGGTFFVKDVEIHFTSPLRRAHTASSSPSLLPR